MKKEPNQSPEPTTLSARGSSVTFGKMKHGSRWLAAGIALPIGALLGGWVGSAICVAILRAQGMGRSHNDMFTIVAAQLGGAVIGAGLLPPLAWRLEGRRKKHLSRPATSKAE